MDRSEPKSILRIITGTIFGLICLWCIIHGGLPLLLLLCIIVTLGSKEYVQILEHKGFYPSLKVIISANAIFAIVAFFNCFNLIPLMFTAGTITAFLWVLFKGRQPYIANAATTVLGFVYCGWFPLHIMFLRNIGSEAPTNWQMLLSSDMTNAGLGYVMLMFWSVIFTDVGCYYVGKNFGKHKLAPVISPKKTIEGSIGGAVLTMLVGYGLGCLFNIPWYHAIFASLLVATFAQLGDLCESLIKRDAGVKDSGDALPGHGGFLDRSDSYIFTIPVMYYYFTYFVQTNGFVDIANFVKGFIS